MWRRKRADGGDGGSGRNVVWPSTMEISLIGFGLFVFSPGALCFMPLPIGLVTEQSVCFRSYEIAQRSMVTCETIKSVSHSNVPAFSRMAGEGGGGGAKPNKVGADAIETLYSVEGNGGIAAWKRTMRTWKGQWEPERGAMVLLLSQM